MFSYDNCMIIENELFIQTYVLYYIFAIKDLNDLNRMLTVYFALMIYWYTNRGQNSSTANDCIDVSLRLAAQWDRVGDSDILYTKNIC